MPQLAGAGIDALIQAALVNDAGCHAGADRDVDQIAETLSRSIPELRQSAYAAAVGYEGGLDAQGLLNHLPERNFDPAVICGGFNGTGGHVHQARRAQPDGRQDLARVDAVENTGNAAF